MKHLFAAIRRLLILVVLAAFAVVGGGIVADTEQGKAAYQATVEFIDGLKAAQKSPAGEAPAVQPAAATAAIATTVAPVRQRVPATYDMDMIRGMVALARAGDRDAMVDLAGMAFVLFVSLNLILNAAVRTFRRPAKPLKKAQNAAFSF